MNKPAIQGASAHKLAPLHGERFEAFATTGLALHDAKPRRLEIGEVHSLDDAVTQAQMLCPHKTFFFIRRVDRFTGAVTLHFYVIKQQSKARWVRRPGFAHPVQERSHYAEHLFDLALTGELV